MAFLIVLGLVMAASSPSSAQQLSTWIVPWDKAAPVDVECFDEVALFNLALSTEGRVVQVAELSRPERGVVYPVVVNDIFSGGKLTQLKSSTILGPLLTQPKVTVRHIAELVEAAKDYDGLEIDYERIPADLWEPFTRFIEILGAELKAQGKKLFVDLEAWPLLRGTAAKQYWPRIAAASDGIKLMAYYQNGGVALSPRPGNTLEWVRDTSKKALDLLGPDKLVVAVSLAATDWRASMGGLPPWRGTRLHYGKAQALLKEADSRRNGEGEPPYFVLARDGRRHEIWYEDEASLKAKIDALRSIGVKRVGLWYWGAVHPDCGQLKGAGN